ncbi:hypothetical protein ANN_20837 [Periplaneta americana]|uniref:Uncharacterized protein n=1 Tax=Periplaneta americana TaxID=6978 RepID=A0ABQ8SDQ7_PERAM|nr:hypothetical protein ANN_20837 [Periplaneta americana]
MAGSCEGGNEPPGSLKAKEHAETLDRVHIGQWKSRDVESKITRDTTLITEKYYNSDEGEARQVQRRARVRLVTESYPAFARIGLRENPGKNLNQITCPDRDSNPGHLVSRPDPSPY